MKTTLRAIAPLLAGFTLISACKKEDAAKGGISRQDTSYVLTSIRRNEVIMDSLVYDPGTLLLKTIISPAADGKSIYSKLEFIYNKDNKVQRIVHYNGEGQLYLTDSLSWNSTGFAVYTAAPDVLFSDSTQYTLDTEGQPTQIGTKDTVTSQLYDARMLNYSLLQLNNGNTVRVQTNSYQSNATGYSTSSQEIAMTYDTGLNPFYRLYRNCPMLVDYWQPQLDYAFDAQYNPATATVTQNTFNTATNTRSSVSDNTSFTYVYDSTSHYPLEQQYALKVTNENGPHTEQYVIKFNYTTIVQHK